MITNPLLEEMYQVQRELTEEAGNDVRKYMENIKRIVPESKAKYGVDFEYADAIVDHDLKESA